MSSMHNDWSYFFKNPWIKEDHESLEAGWQEENDNPEQLQPVLWMSRLQSRMPGCKSNFADVSVFDDLCSYWWRMLLFLNHEMRCTLTDSAMIISHGFIFSIDKIKNPSNKSTVTQFTDTTVCDQSSLAHLIRDNHRSGFLSLIITQNIK